MDKTSTDVVVREGTTVTLECSAKGYPEPYVAWRREDGKAVNYNGEAGKNGAVSVVTMMGLKLQLLFHLQFYTKKVVPTLIPSFKLFELFLIRQM